MNVDIITRSEELVENMDYRAALSINVDGEEKFFVSDGEPEDSTLGRDFSACFSIGSLMQMAHKAGLDGQDLVIKNLEGDI